MDRKLPCKYSESRVGKVVGRRRKRPLEDAVGTVNSSEWVIANYAPSPAMPSPANTSMSEDSTKLLNVNWMHAMDSNDHTDFVTFNHGEASPAQTADSFNLVESKTWPDSTGLTTPALSPPQYAYLSPMMLENKAVSGPGVTRIDNANSRFLAPAMPSPVRRTPEPEQADDEEMVCIRLLGHLKKSSAREHQSLDNYLGLIKKSNAAIRRILKSRKARSEYTCLMLLSSIMLRVVELCEKAVQKHLEELESGDAQLPNFTNNFFDESEQAYFNGDFQFEPVKLDKGAMLKGMLMQAVDLALNVGILLKRKPLNGFQTVGRHEALHLDLEQRLKASLASLS